MASTNILASVARQMQARNGYTPPMQYKTKAGFSLKADASSMGPAASGMSGYGGSANMIATSLWPSQYQYYFTGILPAEPYLTDPASLAYFFRDIYMYDSIGGSVVDLMVNLPFSDFMLQGLDNDRKRVYEDAVSQLNLRAMFQNIAWAYYVDGFFCGTTIYDTYQKRFSDTMIHDALQCAVRTTPFFNKDPNITVTVSNVMSQFLFNASSFNKRYVDALPSSFKKLLKQGRWDLNPATTLFVPRRRMTDRPYVSYLHRILPMYLIEKSMFRGTLMEAQRRQRAMTHVTAGDGDWTPSPEELEAIVNQFMAAELDPIGGWITTRNSVQATDVRPGGDFWKWTDMMEQLGSYKLRALGVSESFLGSDGVTFQAHEASYSMFMEGQNESREQLTARVFYERVFPIVAISNNFFRDKKSAARGKSLEDYFYNASDRANLLMPRVHWKKDLEAQDEDDTFDMLEKASEHGVPIPLRRYMAAAHIDPEALVRDLEEDVQLRKVLQQVTGKDTTHATDSAISDYEQDGGDDYETKAFVRLPNMTVSQPYKPKVPFLSRFPGVADEVFDYSKTGKKKHVPSVLQSKRRKEANEAISKISARVSRDPNYRLDLVKRNAAKLGKTRFKLG